MRNSSRGVSWARRHTLHICATFALAIVLPTIFILPRVLPSTPQPQSQAGTGNADNSSPPPPSPQQNGVVAPPVRIFENLCSLSDKRGWNYMDGNVWVPIGGNLDKPIFVPPRPSSWSWASAEKLCVITQSSSVHSPQATAFSIDRFIASWVSQYNPNWELVLVDFSASRNESFPYLHSYVKDWIAEYESFRIKIVNSSRSPYYEWASSSPSFPTLFSTTTFNPFPALWDVASKYCHANTSRILFTESTHWYHPDFVKSVFAESGDIVGVDFFSNDALQRMGMESSKRSCLFLTEEAPCACNRIIADESPLSTITFDHKKWRALGETFSDQVVNCSRDPQKPRDWDTCLIQALLALDWTRTRVKSCLLSSAPNPHLCALYGFVTAHTTGFANEDFMCVPSKDIAELLIQEEIAQFPIPFFESSCFHATRLGTMSDYIQARSAKLGASKLSSATSGSILSELIESNTTIFDPSPIAPMSL